MRKQRESRSGQVMTEYALMICLFAGVALTLLFVLAAMMKYGWRVLSFIAWEPFLD